MSVFLGYFPFPPPSSLFLTSIIYSFFFAMYLAELMQFWGTGATAI